MIYYSAELNNLILLVEEYQLGGYCLEDEEYLRLLPKEIKQDYLEYWGYELVGFI